MKDKQCIFCNDLLSGNRSLEHIFPQWLLAFLDIKDEVVTPTHFDNTGNSKSTRKHDLNSMLMGRVCKKCNNGWMSELEQKVMKNLSKLITSEIEVIELNQLDRFELAKWTAKTAYLLNYYSNFDRKIPIDHIKLIYKNNDIAKNVIVLAQQHHGESKFYWFQSASWVCETNQEKRKDIEDYLQKESYKISLQFGKLILLIACIPSDRFSYIVWKGIHVPLYPTAGPIYYYDKEHFPWNDSVEAISAFHMGLQCKIV